MCKAHENFGTTKIGEVETLPTPERELGPDLSPLLLNKKHTNNKVRFASAKRFSLGENKFVEPISRQILGMMNLTKELTSNQ